MEEVPNPAAVAFISHHSSQHETARHLKNLLARRGLAGWMAPDDIDPGKQFDSAIVDQVAQSDAIVLLFCAQSDQSRHVKRELMLAEDNGTPILPVRLEDIDPNGLAYWLKDYQWIDWIDRRDATIERLADTIGRLAGAPQSETVVASSAAPAPGPPEATRKTDETPASKGLGAGAWLTIGGFAFAVIVAGIAMVSTMGGVQLRAGEWRSEIQATEIIYSDFPAIDLATINRGYEPQTVCVSRRLAENPDVEIFDQMGASDCEARQFYMENGEYRADLDCRFGGPNNPSTNVALEGRYDQTAMDGVGVFTFETPDGRLQFRTEMQSRYRGECD